MKYESGQAKLIQSFLITAIFAIVLAGCGGSSGVSSTPASGGSGSSAPASGGGGSSAPASGSSGGSTPSSGAATTSYSIGGSISGLVGTLVLHDTTGGNLSVSTNGNFTFATSIASGSSYNVTVFSQPAGQTCSVSTGAGVVSGSNVTNVAVICSINTHQVWGLVSGLTGSVILQDNNGDNITVSINGPFTFPAQIADGSPYSVTVLTPPTGQNCSVANGTGTINGFNITDVTVTCASSTYTIGGAVTGLNGSMVLQNNGGDNLTVSTNGPFTFATAVAYGNPYKVTVPTQPTGQLCTVSGGSGTVTGANITNINISCGISPLGTFTIANNLNSVLVRSTATLLSTGNILVEGGASFVGANLYDPTTGVWSNTGRLTTPRDFASATLLPNGQVLIAGGTSGNDLTSAELYNPATNAWTTAASLATARDSHTATLLPNGKVLVVGGRDISTASATNSSELYDPASNTWTATGNLITARYNHTATLLPNGKVLVAGGIASGGVFALSSAELYDPSTGVWSSTGNLATARNAHTATLLPNGLVLVAGGVVTSALASTELYNPATGLWAATGSLNVARYLHTATLLPSGKVLVAGGMGAATLGSAELYDPTSNLWTTTGNLNTARYLHTATLLQNGKVVIAGGTTGATGLSSTEIYW